MTIQYAISHTTAASSFGQFSNIPSDTEDPPSHGLWDPVVRRALRRALAALYQEPDRSRKFDDSREARRRLDRASQNCGGSPADLSKTAFFAAIAQEVIEQAELLQETADEEGEQQGAIAVATYISRFIEDYCSNELTLTWPFSSSAPPWFGEELNEADLILTGVQFWRAAMETLNDRLRQTFAEVGAEFVRIGLARLQPAGQRM